MHNPTFPASPLAVIHTLPPTEPPAERARHLLPLVMSVVVHADLLRADALAFWPARMGGHAGRVDRTEAAPFVCSDPARPHATLAALEEVLAVPHERGPDPGGPGPARSLRD